MKIVLVFLCNVYFAYYRFFQEETVFSKTLLFFFKELGPWSEWTDCSLTCNGGERSRRRICGLDPTSKSKDNPCKAPLKETEKCNTDKCPVFTQWSDWSTCSKTCGNGNQQRERECVAFSEASTRLFCEGSLEQSQVKF